MSPASEGRSPLQTSLIVGEVTLKALEMKCVIFKCV